METDSVGGNRIVIGKQNFGGRRSFYVHAVEVVIACPVERESNFVIVGGESCSFGQNCRAVVNIRQGAVVQAPCCAVEIIED